MKDFRALIESGFKFLFGRFLKQTKVTGIERISKSFVLIEVAGSKLRDLRFAPGSKIQLDVGQMTFRTYTPLEIDPKNGSLRFLFYRRSGSPATKWVDALKIGDSCEIFGPRDSLSFSALEGNMALFGDETSIGVSQVLRGSAARASIFLEANSAAETDEVLGRVGLVGAKIFQRSAERVHLEQIVQEILFLDQRGKLSSLFLTGRASSIQKIKAGLKAAGFPSSEVKTKAYWADGKAGLD